LAASSPWAGRSTRRHPRQAGRELGYESVYVTHINGRESLTVLTHYAAHTDRIRLGTGVVPIYTRTPATMAQTAATIDEVSGGRLVLGPRASRTARSSRAGTGQTIDKPGTEMREYVAILRAILAGEDPPAGDKWQTGFRSAWRRARPADLRRRALAADAADRRRDRRRRGALAVQPALHPRRRRPEVAKGREKAGKPLDGLRHRRRRAPPR
jgi:alkanesulfonate monooxygenase SsuD/methylene tetrahydromethanopterin reductase-like flavin-dependent oxidoreductase (luciferase family)